MNRSKTKLQAMAVCTVLLIGLPLALQAQADTLGFYTQAQTINNVGMGILGGWAMANLATGAIGWSQHTGQQAYFHQMNFFWNTVNLAIAGFALYGSLSMDLALKSGQELLDMQHKTQRLFLINAGLDVAYMGTGLLLRTLGPRSEKHGPRLLGYGNSVILQGGFLFVFDLVLYFLQRDHRTDFLQHLSLAPMSEAWGLHLALNF